MPKKGWRKYPVNDYFFHTWTYSMAYILGFCMADCTIKNAKKEGLKRRGFVFKLKDYEPVEYVRNEISPTRPIRVSRQFDKRTKKTYTSHLFECSSHILVAQLESFGVISNRTGNESLPEIPELFKAAFLRGLFDGDGTVKYRRRPNTLGSYEREVNFSCACKEFMMDIINNFPPLNHTTLYRERNSEQHLWKYKPRIFCRDAIITFHNYIYSTPPVFCLQRKKQIFENIINRTLEA